MIDISHLDTHAFARFASDGSRIVDDYMNRYPCAEHGCILSELPHDEIVDLLEGFGRCTFQYPFTIMKEGIVWDIMGFRLTKAKRINAYLDRCVMASHANENSYAVFDMRFVNGFVTPISIYRSAYLHCILEYALDPEDEFLLKISL